MAGELIFIPTISYVSIFTYFSKNPDEESKVDLHHHESRHQIPGYLSPNEPCPPELTHAT
jgi:hypothetical protein